MYVIAFSGAWGGSKRLTDPAGLAPFSQKSLWEDASNSSTRVSRPSLALPFFAPFSLHMILSSSFLGVLLIFAQRSRCGSYDLIHNLHVCETKTSKCVYFRLFCPFISYSLTFTCCPFRDPSSFILKVWHPFTPLSLFTPERISCKQTTSTGTTSSRVSHILTRYF